MVDTYRAIPGSMLDGTFQLNLEMSGSKSRALAVFHLANQSLTTHRFFILTSRTLLKFTLPSTTMAHHPLAPRLVLVVRLLRSSQHRVRELRVLMEFVNKAVGLDYT